ncbi:MAG TPA: helix-turn-helix domain-containing protein [Acidimicrobiales bacterium]|nr:helix-turn-helix domain-containing protein [Acidimicrobiales bacterium]
MVLRQDGRPAAGVWTGADSADCLVVSVAEAAAALGVSDDLVYHLTERGELPCLRIGRRKVIPRRAIELLVESAVAGFDPPDVLRALAGRRAPRDPAQPAPPDARPAR